MFTCPGEGCSNIMSLDDDAGAHRDADIDDVVIRDREASESLARHLYYLTYRLRCRECGVVFCASCREKPYHIGYTCEAWASTQLKLQILRRRHGLRRCDAHVRLYRVQAARFVCVLGTAMRARMRRYPQRQRRHGVAGGGLLADGDAEETWRRR